MIQSRRYFGFHPCYLVLMFLLLRCIGIPGAQMVAVDSSKQCANVCDAVMCRFHKLQLAKNVE